VSAAITIQLPIVLPVLPVSCSYDYSEHDGQVAISVSDINIVPQDAHLLFRAQNL
jgi:hypothetical protein